MLPCIANMQQDNANIMSVANLEVENLVSISGVDCLSAVPRVVRLSPVVWLIALDY